MKSTCLVNPYLINKEENINDFSDSLQQDSSSINKEDNFLIPRLGTYSSFPIRVNSHNHFSVHLLDQRIKEESPSCSSPIEKRKLPNKGKTFKGIIKNDPEFYDISYLHSIKREEQDISCIKEISNSSQQIEFKEEIKKERDVFSENKHDAPYEENKKLSIYPESVSVCSIKEKKKMLHLVSNFYQREMNHLIQSSSFKEKSSTISDGIYDYKRSHFCKMIGISGKMEIEVLNKNIASFDKSLVIKHSSYRFSKNLKRRFFQTIIRKEINSLKKDIFSSFVRLSIDDRKSNYINWKKLILGSLFELSDKIVKENLKTNFREVFQKSKKGLSFIENELHFAQKVLIREVMRYALFSVPIEIIGKEKNILISRATMGSFLNKYSNFFLEKMLHYERKGIFTEKMNGRYSLWRKSKNDFITRMLEELRPKFSKLLQSDRESIHDHVWALEPSGFRSLENQEVDGLLCFVERLFDFKGPYGLIEKACHRFHEQEYPKNIQRKNKKLRLKI